MLALIIAAPSSSIPIFVMKVLCFALFACAFNLLIGYVGLLSFGHAAYFGIGSYIARLDRQVLGPRSGGRDPGRRPRGRGAGQRLRRARDPSAGHLHFAMITLALGQLVYFFCVQAPFTGGENGIQQVPRGALFGVLPSPPT